ncbi:putative cysteine-rich receptor-like protein kinase 31 isoform X1 [Capsella rubella]|uniref:putative cysteine-rich receptor-like protein kinase 31 isoform X1 n=1 Tax=Capsella rubella TaxID=81985 RepID=UPI000CD4F81F|nr:putative cysteine-rich receptor-like protein kinase 31 isoform X1 [Capsella rubella]
MCLNNVFSILCFVLAVSFGFVSAQRCGDSLFFTPNSTYDTNRRLVLSTLASNVSSQNNRSYNVSVGEGTERIFAIGLCIPRTDPKICSDCIQAASEGLLKNCPNQTDSFDWRRDKTLCFVRYSNNSFFNKIDLEPTVTIFSTKRFLGNAQIEDYNRTWDALMNFMITRIGQSRYLSDISPEIGSYRIYTLMQCIPGISSEDCETCIQVSVRNYQRCCSAFVGGVVAKPVCFFRWDRYPYFGVFGNTQSLPPQESQPTLLPPHQGGKNHSTGVIVGIGVSAVIIIVLLGLGLVTWKRRQSYKTLKPQIKHTYVIAADNDMISPQSLQFDFSIIETATDKFSMNNKLGQGGFGEVYKGMLPNETEIAVKRLSRNSGQGTQEFKNEVVIVAKLQHKNLVRLLGFCVERDEQMLVYEFVQNKSLDYFLFDQTKKSQLDWKRRYNIIGGITRGLLYLHQDSRLTIIHRDIKASNILLDADMNPKIADFGMARNFRVDQTEDNTRRVVGTFGYMPPEYVTHGQFSTKSDIYSFGVLVLEIVCGKKNSSFYRMDDSGGNLVTHVWRVWNNESPLDLIDPAIKESYDNDEVIRCIHIGILCVQETPADRPAMSTIFQMLTNSSITLPVPRPPGFFFRNRTNLDPLNYGSNLGQSSSMLFPFTDSESITRVSPR